MYFCYILSKYAEILKVIRLLDWISYFHLSSLNLLLPI